MYQSYLDKSTPFATYRWVGTVVLLLVFFLRIFLVQGWYIGTFPPLSAAPSAAIHLSCSFGSPRICIHTY